MNAIFRAIVQKTKFVIGANVGTLVTCIGLSVRWVNLILITFYNGDKMSFDKSDLTTEEKKAVTRMANAMKILSERHWFFAASGNLILMRYGEKGEHALIDGFEGMDQDYSVCTIGEGCDIDGGDW